MRFAGAAETVDEHLGGGGSGLGGPLRRCGLVGPGWGLSVGLDFRFVHRGGGRGGCGGDARHDRADVGVDGV